MALTLKQRLFASEYIQSGGNGRLAAQAAGYSGDANALAVQASRLLRNANVVAALAMPLKAAEITAERITEEVMTIALGEPQEPIRYDHKLKALQLLAKIKGMTKDQHIHQRQINTMQLIQLRDACAKETYEDEGKVVDSCTLVDPG